MKRCLERFEVHSWYRWTWNGKVWVRGCSLMGCVAAQEVAQVRPVSRTPLGKAEAEEPVYIPGKGDACKLHGWDTWKLIEDFWVKNNLYHERTCAVCGAKQYAHDLAATEKPKTLSGEDDGSW